MRTQAEPHQGREAFTVAFTLIRPAAYSSSKAKMMPLSGMPSSPERAFTRSQRSGSMLRRMYAGMSLSLSGADDRRDDHPVRKGEGHSRCRPAHVVLNGHNATVWELVVNHWTRSNPKCGVKW